MTEFIKEKRCLMELQDALTVSRAVDNRIVHISPETAELCEKALSNYIRDLENGARKLV